MRKFEDLRPDEKAKICNGCGGKGGKITPPYAVMFKADCNHHDYGYWKGGDWKARLKCDWRLLKAMLKDALAFKWRLHKTAYFSGWSLAYFIGVRAAGWKFFHYGEVRDIDTFDWENM